MMIRETDQLLLQEHHRQLEQLLSDVDLEVRIDDLPALRQRWATFEQALNDHMALEEQTLLPDYARAHPDDAAQLFADHRRFRELLAECGIETDLHCLRREVTAALADELRAHVRRENELLYPWAAQHVAKWPGVLEQIRERVEHLRHG